MKKKRTKKRLTDELSVRRFLIKMKLPLFLLMILFLSVNTIAFSQTAKISVNFTETPLSEVFVPPELTRDFDIVLYKDEKIVKTVQVRNNHQRFCPCYFEKTLCDSFKIKIRATNGADTVCIFEIRAY